MAGQIEAPDVQQSNAPGAYPMRYICAPLQVGPNSLARPGIIRHHRDEDDDCSNGMHEPTQNCRDDVEQYAENRAPQLDGKRTGRNALLH